MPHLFPFSHERPAHRRKTSKSHRVHFAHTHTHTRRHAIHLTIGHLKNNLFTNRTFASIYDRLTALPLTFRKTQSHPSPSDGHCANDQFHASLQQHPLAGMSCAQICDTLNSRRARGSCSRPNWTRPMTLIDGENWSEIRNLRSRAASKNCNWNFIQRQRREMVNGPKQKSNSTKTKKRNQFQWIYDPKISANRVPFFPGIWCSVSDIITSTHSPAHCRYGID